METTPSNAESAYVVAPVSLRTRIGNGIGIFIVGISVFSGAIAVTPWLGLVVLPITLFLVYKVARPHSTNQLRQEVVDVPREEIRKKLKIATVIYLGLMLLTALYSFVMERQHMLENAIGFSALYTIPYVGYALSLFLQRKRVVYTAPAAVEHERVEAEKRAQETASSKATDEFMDRWYFRYPLGIMFLGFSWWMPTQKPDAWWYPIVAVILALVFMREIGVYVLGAVVVGGLAWAFFGALSALPLSVAIIIGALIIANSRSK